MTLKTLIKSIPTATLSLTLILPLSATAETTNNNQQNPTCCQEPGSDPAAASEANSTHKNMEKAAETKNCPSHSGGNFAAGSPQTLRDRAQLHSDPLRQQDAEATVHLLLNPKKIATK